MMELTGIADTLIDYFLAHDIHVMRYDSISTSSIYLKLDYGVLYSIRLGDHEGKSKLSYRFNVLEGYSGDRYIKSRWDWYREYYSTSKEDLNAMCRSIMSLRDKRKAELGTFRYNHKMVLEKRRGEKAVQHSFWGSAKDLG